MSKIQAIVNVSIVGMLLDLQGGFASVATLHEGAQTRMSLATLELVIEAGRLSDLWLVHPHVVELTPEGVEFVQKAVCAFSGRLAPTVH